MRGAVLVAALALPVLLTSCGSSDNTGPRGEVVGRAYDAGPQCVQDSRAACAGSTWTLTIKEGDYHYFIAADPAVFGACPLFEKYPGCAQGD